MFMYIWCYLFCSSPVKCLTCDQVPGGHLDLLPSAHQISARTNPSVPITAELSCPNENEAWPFVPLLMNTAKHIYWTCTFSLLHMLPFFPAHVWHVTVKHRVIVPGAFSLVTSCHLLHSIKQMCKCKASQNSSLQSFIIKKKILINPCYGWAFYLPSIKMKGTVDFRQIMQQWDISCTK